MCEATTVSVSNAMFFIFVLVAFTEGTNVKGAVTLYFTYTGIFPQRGYERFGILAETPVVNFRLNLMFTQKMSPLLPFAFRYGSSVTPCATGEAPRF